MCGCARAVRDVPACALIGTLLFATGCQDVVVAPPGPAQPVVQIILVAGRVEQTASVLWSTPAPGVPSGQPLAVPTDQVSLRLISTDGSEAAFQPVAKTPGKFAASRLVASNETYELTGSIAGMAITARVTVPGPLQVTSPATDTVTISTGGFLLGHVLPVAWNAPGAASLHSVAMDSAGESIVSQGSLREHEGQLSVFPPHHPPATSTVIFSAYDVNATQFIFSDPPESSIPGGFGVFGAAVSGPSVIIKWE